MYFGSRCLCSWCAEKPWCVSWETGELRGLALTLKVLGPLWAHLCAAHVALLPSRPRVSQTFPPESSCPLVEIPSEVRRSVCCWALRSVLLIHLSRCVSAPHRSDSCGSVGRSNQELLCLKIVLAYVGPLTFPMKFGICLSVSAWKPRGG